MKEAMITWANENGETYPKYVVMFRNGVSDDQLHLTKKHEGDQMVNAINNINGNETSFTYIIVEKRISTRLFLKQLRMQPVSCQFYIYKVLNLLLKLNKVLQ
jgi:hypothetical protein